MSLAEAMSFQPGLSDAPPLRVVNDERRQAAPEAIVDARRLAAAGVGGGISWTEAEWAALNQVFCAGIAPMPYSARTRNSWDGLAALCREHAVGAFFDNGVYWVKHADGDRASRAVVQVEDAPPSSGAKYLEELIQRLI